MAKNNIDTANCAICNCVDDRFTLEDDVLNWMGRPITLQLDFIDGDNTNHRLSNLRIVCPNCRAQAEFERNQKPH